MSTQLPVHRSLGAEVQRRRAALGLTQAALADKVAACGDWTIRQSDISRLERGVVTLPHASRLRFLAAALEVPVGDLLVSSGWVGGMERIDTVDEWCGVFQEADIVTIRTTPRESSALENRPGSEEMALALDQVVRDLSAAWKALERVSDTMSRLLAGIDASEKIPRDPMARSPLE